jgi:hypothetical protein
MDENRKWQSSFIENVPLTTHDQTILLSLVSLVLVKEWIPKAKLTLPELLVNLVGLG